METQRTLFTDLADFLVGPTDPKEQLDLLRRDQLEANAEIRAVLDRLAEKHNVPHVEVDQAMANVGLTIDDMTHEAENDYLAEIEVTDPV